MIHVTSISIGYLQRKKLFHRLYMMVKVERSRGVVVDIETKGFFNLRLQV